MLETKQVSRKMTPSEEMANGDMAAPFPVIIPKDVYKLDQDKKHRLWTEKRNSKGEVITSSDGTPILVLRKHWEKIMADILLENSRFLTFGEVRNEVYYYSEGQGIYIPGGETQISWRTEELTEGLAKNQNIQEVIGHIKRKTYFDRDSIYKTPSNLICFLNGVLDINSMKIWGHSPDVVFTQQVPHRFVDTAQCPQIMDFLNQILDPEDLPLVQELVGYILYRSYSFKKAFICVGEPDTGKTTFISLLVRAVGLKNTSGLSLHRIARDRFGVASMEHKMLNFYDDLGFEDIDNVGAFKIATGGGYIQAEKKFGENFNFPNFAKLVFACNKIPAVKDTDDLAYYGRWIILFFDNIFDKNNPDTDPNILEKITSEEELEGLIAWGAQGLKRLLKNKGFSYRYSPKENKQIMESSSSSISSFVSACILPGDGWISKEDMYGLYSKYCDELEIARLTKEKFGRDLPTKASYIHESRRDTLDKKSVKGWGNLNLNNTNNTILNNTSTINSIYYFPPRVLSEKVLFPLFEGQKTLNSIGNDGTNEEKVLFPLSKQDNTNNTISKKDLENSIKKTIEDAKNGIKESDLQLEFSQLEFDDFCGIIDDLKVKGDIMESPKGMLRAVA